MIRKIKDLVKAIIIYVVSLLPPSKYIVFESVPNFSDSPKAVFDEFIRRGYGAKYKFIWWLHDEQVTDAQSENCICLNTAKFFHRLLFRWYLLRARCLISCNRFLESETVGQVSFYITHGTVIKRTGASYVLPKNIDYAIVASDHVREVMAWDLEADVNKFYGLGYPRNDALQKEDHDLHPFFPVEFEKIVVWYPTFRQHKNGNVTGSRNALPILHNAENARRLNEIVRSNNTLLVVKPHFAQDVSYIKDCNLSNIQFIDDKFFETHGISSYEFVGSCDALITDYSSIYYDFLLCDKPVAAIWEDIEEYRSNPGFSLDIDYYMKGAEKIYDLDDFERFILHLANGIDFLHDERKEINDLVSYSTDGKNTERVANFIIEKAKL